MPNHYRGPAPYMIVYAWRAPLGFLAEAGWGIRDSTPEVIGVT